MRQIEILYSDGCPGWRGTLERVQAVVRQLGLDGCVSIEMVPVETHDDARRLRFVGSPTVRIDGRDVEAAAEERTSFGLQCRLYEGAARLEGMPAERLLRAALARNIARGSSPCP